MNKLYLIYLCLLLVKSPNEKINLSFNDDQGHLTYTLYRQNASMFNYQSSVMLDTSVISIFNEAQVTILECKLQAKDTTWEPVWGQFSKIRNHYNEMILSVKTNGHTGKLMARVYNNGIAFRFKLDKVSKSDAVNFYCEYNLPEADSIYHSANGSDTKGPLSLYDIINAEKVQQYSIPIVVKDIKNQYFAILESDLIACPEFRTMKVNADLKKHVLISTSQPNAINGELTTPWKVFLFGSNNKSNVGSLVTNTIALNLATPNVLGDASWVTPGKTLWDWRVHGFKTKDGFVYGINDESYKRYIDFAHNNGIKYFLIDADWYTKTTKGHFDLTKELNLPEIIYYAKQKNVDILLYYDRHKGNYGDDELFSYYKSLGVKGIKYGFMGDNPVFTRKAVRLSADNKLLLDLHDSPTPISGAIRTYPNYITREYCHAQQDSRTVFTPETFIKMALVNAIQGPMDMNNGNFNINSINRGERMKGPKKKHSYFTTVSAEVARTLIIFSGLVCLPDAPEAYQAKADLFEFIKKMPVGKWNETRILNASMGHYITTARRHGQEWFIGSVIDRKGGSIDIKLDFLKADKKYVATFYEDTDDTDCYTNPEAYQVKTMEVSKGQVINAKLARGGGQCIWIRPMDNMTAAFVY